MKFNKRVGNADREMIPQHIGAHKRQHSSLVIYSLLVYCMIYETMSDLIGRD